jgi:DNA-binding XRE family transcriptional regulator
MRRRKSLSSKQDFNFVLIEDYLIRRFAQDRVPFEKTQDGPSKKKLLLESLALSTIAVACVGEVAALPFFYSDASQGFAGKSLAKSESFTKVQKRVRATLGRKVRDLRRSGKLSQADLAESAGIRRALVSDVERGGANPRLDTILRIATALNVELSELLSAKD